MADYPAQYESDVVLRNGSTLHLRPIGPGDLEKLHGLYLRLSPESLYFRFFGTQKWDDERAARLTHVDYESEFALVGESAGRIDAVARYVRDPSAYARAEAAFAVADAVQGQGIGMRMLERLAEIAREHRITTFDGYVLQDNYRMMHVFLDSGFDVQRRLEGGIIHVTLSLTRTPAFEASAALRAQHAATASMNVFFEPKVVRNDAFGQPPWQSVQLIAATAARAGNEARGTVLHVFEDKRPRQQRRVVWRRPADDEKALRLERQHREAVGHSRQRREDHAGGEVLKLRDDACGARLATVVEEIVAVPSRATSRTHLHEPRPHVMSRASDGESMRQRCNRFGDDVVARKRAQSLVTSGSDGLAKHGIPRFPIESLCRMCRDLAALHRQCFGAPFDA